MAVLEFALLQLRPNYDRSALLQVLQHLLPVQDEWMCQNRSQWPKEDSHSHLSTTFITAENPPFLLIMAPWESPEAHEQWIQSRENQSGFKVLEEFLASGENSLSLFHMTPVWGSAESLPPLKNISDLHVFRASVTQTEKSGVEELYQDVIKNLLGSAGEVVLFWCGWRIEKSEHDELEELVVLTTSNYCIEKFRDSLNAVWMSNLRYIRLTKH